jgi:hypothetical protein
LNNPTSGSYDTKNVGINKTVSVSGVALTGVDKNNYTLASSSLSGNIGIIDAAQLVASLTGTVEKTYDGTTAATLTASNYLLSGAVAGDSVGLNNPTNGTYDTKNVGINKTVSVNGVALTGVDKNNYTLASSSLREHRHHRCRAACCISDWHGREDLRRHDGRDIDGFELPALGHCRGRQCRIEQSDERQLRHQECRHQQDGERQRCRTHGPRQEQLHTGLQQPLGNIGIIDAHSLLHL